jgi:hypothetical protein
MFDYKQELLSKNQTLPRPRYCTIIEPKQDLGDQNVDAITTNGGCRVETKAHLA